jgi:hypothetical protein
MRKQRIWRPLDVNGLRLYKVTLYFHNHPLWNETLIVAAKSPSEARRLIEKAHDETVWVETPIVTGEALVVYQPKEWTE